MKDQKLTVTLHIGDKQVESLTSEQCERMAQRLSDAMSTYYTAHPSEFANLERKQHEKV